MCNNDESNFKKFRLKLENVFLLVKEEKRDVFLVLNHTLQITYAVKLQSKERRMGMRILYITLHYLSFIGWKADAQIRHSFEDSDYRLYRVTVYDGSVLLEVFRREAALVDNSENNITNALV